MITGNEYDPEKTDLWSAGITLYYMLIGKLPFNDKHIKDLYKKIVEGNVDYPSSVSLEATDLLRSILRVIPNRELDSRKYLLTPGCRSTNRLVIPSFRTKIK